MNSINYHFIILFKVATGSTNSSPSLSNISVAKATTTSITTPTSSTIISVTNSPVCTPNTPVTSAYIPGISRPRGRPPGSKNTNTKVNDPMRITSIPPLPCSNWSMISSLITILLQPLSPATASLPNMDMITGFLDPSIRQTVINLLSAPPFMTQLSNYTDSVTSIGFIDSYLRVLNVQNVTQAREGFISVLNRLATALTPSSMLNTMNLPAKPLKSDKVSVGIPKSSSSMTIFPVPSKPQSITATSSKSNMNTSTLPSASITSASNAMKSGAATVISMSSGQLTITPRSSISITANPKPSSSIPKLQSPTSNTQKQSKIKQPLKDRPQSLPREFQLDLPIRGLPESLSITPSASIFSPTKKTMPSPMSIDPHVINKPTKATKTQRKSSEASNKIATNKGNTSSIQPYASRNLDQQRIDLSKVSGMQDFYSQYQQYLKMQSSLKATKSNVISNPSSPLIPQPKSTIKVKNLDQLISEPKQNPKPSQKAKPQTFPTPNVMAKNQTLTNNNSALLNSYGTTISSLLQSPQKIQPSYAPIISSTANITSPIRFVSLQYFHLIRFKSIFIHFLVHQKRYNKN